MDIFAYISLGLLAAIVLGVVFAYLWEIVREPLGQAMLLALGLIGIIVCAVVGGVWLIGTRLI